jgi:hypothetical protein
VLQEIDRENRNFSEKVKPYLLCQSNVSGSDSAIQRSASFYFYEINLLVQSLGWRRLLK